MELQFSKGKIIGHIVAYVLLFLAGDLLNSLVFDLLFSMVELPIRSLYSVLLLSFLFSLMHIPSMDEFSVAGISLLVISGTVEPGLPLPDPHPLSGGGALSNHRGQPPLYKRLSKRDELRL